MTKDEKNNCHFSNSNAQLLFPGFFQALPSLHHYSQLFGEASQNPALSCPYPLPKLSTAQPAWLSG